jgi:hypothetical protein
MAKNEAIFRDANEHIQRRARELGFEQRVPFICECGEPECRELLRLTLPEYEAVRAGGARFFLLPAHESAVANAGCVIERYDGYLVVEKTGVAREVAEEHDPRKAAEPG